MSETFWILMYMVVTWADVNGGLKRYEPRAQVMPSYAVCIATKGSLSQMSTRDRAFQGIRCEEIGPWNEEYPSLLEQYHSLVR